MDKRYEIQERVGHGSFGEVLRGRDRLTGERVAIKRLIDDDCDKSIRERFRREARYLARIKSPNVVRFLGSGLDASGRPCIALEWLEGTDLAHLLRRGPMPIASAVDIARRAALALGAVHEQGIVHRDVTPANFFLVEEPAPFGGVMIPNVKLIDLGIARAAGEAPLTEPGTRLGTPVYMSPEQARGEEYVTAASDLFALGIVLYELVAGKRPFGGDRTLIVVAKIVLHDPPPLSLARPDAPPELCAIVERALAKSVTDRYASAFAMAEDLGQLAAQLARRSGPLFSWAPMPAWSARQADSVRSPASVEALGPESAPGGAISGRGETRVMTAVFADLVGVEDRTAGRLLFERLAAELSGVSYGTLGEGFHAVRVTNPDGQFDQCIGCFEVRVPESPSNLVISFELNDVKLNWSPAPEISPAYQIYRDTNPDGPFNVMIDEIVDTFYVDNNVLDEPESMFFYVVKTILP